MQVDRLAVGIARNWRVLNHEDILSRGRGVNFRLLDTVVSSGFYFRVSMTTPLPISREPHPLLEAAAFVTDLPSALGEIPSPPALVALLAAAAPTPFTSDDATREAVRALLRHGGFKPSGRSKPASEYLVRAAGEGGLRSINAAVDACNVVSLHSGLPISVVDLDLAKAPFRIGVAPAGTSYIFNPSGQTIDVAGLVMLFDAEGPCAGPVKDSQRTKTHAGTRRTLSVVWGTRDLAGRAERAAAWYRELLQAHLNATASTTA